MPQPTALADRQLFSDVELARYLSVSVSTLRKWRIRKIGPTWLKLGALCRYRLSDVQAWLDSCPRGGSERPADGSAT
jgi:predicted DNA-binding transcriptional regulator AlpA